MSTLALGETADELSAVRAASGHPSYKDTLNADLLAFLRG